MTTRSEPSTLLDPDGIASHCHAGTEPVPACPSGGRARLGPGSIVAVPETRPGDAAADRPPLRARRFRSLDAWRGLACLMVIIGHCSTYLDRQVSRTASGRLALSLLEATHYGVPMFFVISGYCIAAAADPARTLRGSGATFFLRRFRRIYPPYWIFLAATAALVAIARAGGHGDVFDDGRYPIPSPSSLTAAQLLGNLSLTETWRHHVIGGPERFLTGHAWTLCYEEQFYLICGLIVVAAPRRFFAGVAAVTLAVLGIMAARGSIQGLFFDGQWLLFAEGVSAYYWIHHAGRTGRRTLLALLGASIAFTLLTRPATWWHHEKFAEGPAFALLLVWLHRWDDRIAGCRALRPLSWCGAICYSLYLVHLPITKGLSHAIAMAGLDDLRSLILITVPAGVGFSLLAAAAFHRLIERHFLNTPSLARSTPNPVPPR